MRAAKSLGSSAPIALCARYVMCGTKLAYGAVLLPVALFQNHTAQVCAPLFPYPAPTHCSVLTLAMTVPVSAYSLSGTDLAYDGSSIRRRGVQ
eukprot:2792693-Rhodomonas_salina.3